MKIRNGILAALLALVMLFGATACDPNDGVYDEYKDVENALVFEVTDLRDNIATIELMVAGEVKLCGMQGSFTLPKGIKYLSHKEYSGFSAGCEGDTIYFMMAADKGENLTVKAKLLSIEVELDDTFGVGRLGFELSDIYDRDFNTVSYTVYGGSLSLEDILGKFGVSMEDFRK